MRYLKKFNEKVEREEIKDFCEINLAYLLDEGVDVRVSHYDNFEDEVIIDFHEKIFWNECKDHVIPFLSRVGNKYELGCFLYKFPHTFGISKNNFMFVVKGTHGIRVDIPIRFDEINDVEQKLSKQWEGNLIMDQILFYVKNEK
jgi:hypothetical protein